MSDVVGLVLPFFGLIILGYVVAQITRQPVEALGWMNTFIIYVALPALFFQLIAKTPFERLTEWRFIFGSVFSTYIIFSLMFVGSVIMSRGEIAASTIKGLAAAYGNIGYMGAGLALLAFGPEAAVPVALIFCFENILHFAIAPMMMALSGDEKGSPWQLLSQVARKILLHPFIIATAVGVFAAYMQFQPPVPVDRLLAYLSSAAAPCALFAMGVTLALRPLKRIPQARAAPADLLRRTELGRQFFRGLDILGGAAGCAADGHQRLRHGPAVPCLGRAGVGQHSADHVHVDCDGDRADVADKERNITAGPVPVGRRRSPQGRCPDAAPRA